MSLLSFAFFLLLNGVLEIQNWATVINLPTIFKTMSIHVRSLKTSYPDSGRKTMAYTNNWNKISFVVKFLSFSHLNATLSFFPIIFLIFSCESTVLSVCFMYKHRPGDWKNLGVIEKKSGYKYAFIFWEKLWCDMPVIVFTLLRPIASRYIIALKFLNRRKARENVKRWKKCSYKMIHPVVNRQIYTLSTYCVQRPMLDFGGEIVSIQLARDP